MSEALAQNPKYQYLSKQKPTLTEQSKDFSKAAKQFKFLKEAMSEAKSFMCPLCRARLDKKSMNIDHIDDKKDGGLAVVDNAAWAHPYCNSTYKPHLRKSGKLQ